MVVIRYSEIKRDVLSHINQYTIAGVDVPDSYNNQADYVRRIPQLVNAGVMNIRTFVKPLPVSYVLSGGEEYGGFRRHELPENFWKIKSGGVYEVRNGVIQNTNEFKLMGRRTILVPIKDGAEYIVEYYRYPDQLPRNVEADFDFREDPEVIQAAVLYAAANLVMQEDEFSYSCLYADYERQLARMTCGPAAEARTAGDVYGFDAAGGYDA